MRELDLGCGPHKITNAISVDINRKAHPDIIYNLNNIPYPFKDNSFDNICMRHVLEHLNEPEKVLYEVLRIAKNKTKLYIEVPHFSVYASYIFGHKKAYSCQAFKLFCEKNPNFKLKEIKLRWMRDVDSTNFFRHITNSVLSFFANLNYHFCERIWCYWVGGFGEIRVWIEIKK
jgi:predicted SAM-dependent methyltransferase